MRTPWIPMWIVSVSLSLAFLATPRVVAQDAQADYQKLRAAISDLAETFPDRYPDAPQFMQRLEEIEERLAGGDREAYDSLAPTAPESSGPP